MAVGEGRDEGEEAAKSLCFIAAMACASLGNERDVKEEEDD